MSAKATKPEKAQSLLLVPARAMALLASLWVHHTTVTVMWIWQGADESLQDCFHHFQLCGIIENIYIFLPFKGCIVCFFLSQVKYKLEK